MRILAIRGKNLASLADEFEILLNEGALQTAGLFAITGQTGAGKSTILDALCLALYDKMPRLPTGEGFAVGHKDEDESQRVKHNDVRSILRRGASSAFAEVDFIGKDKQPYRARWQVSKARGKASGKLQAQEIQLSNINSGQRIGQTKTNTLEAISQLVDLNFDQFRRSVLLAQGDFAAFLKAKKDERSSLLERITGTELYSEISIAAFERAKTEKLELDRISALMHHQIPLEISERHSVEQQRDLFTVAVLELNKQLADNQKIIDWYAELKKRQVAERAASDALAECSHTWNAAEPLRARVKQVETAEPLRPLLSHYHMAQTDFVDAENKLKSTIDAQAITEIKLHAATQHTTTQTALLTTAETHHQHAQPVLKAIRALDTRLEILQTTLNTLNAEEKQLQTELNTAQQQQHALLKQQAEQINAEQQLSDWLTQHQDLQIIAADWTHWDSELNRYAVLVKHRTTELTAAEKIQQQVATDLQQLSALQIEIDDKKHALLAQQAKLEDIKKRNTGINLQSLHLARETLEVKSEQLNRAVMLANNAHDLQQTLSHDLPLLASTEQTLETTKQQLNTLSQQQTLNEISLEEAKKALALIEATSHKDAQQLRQLLIKDQPCPVCGALEHPWQAHSVQLSNEYTQAQQQRVQQLDSEKSALIKAIAHAYQTIDQAHAKVVELNHNIVLTQEKIRALNNEWLALVVDEKPSFALHEKALLPFLNQHYERVITELNHIKQQEKAALALQEQIKITQHTFDDSKQHYDALTSEYNALEKQHTHNKTELRTHSATIERLETELNDIAEALAVPCGAMQTAQTYLASPATLGKKVQQFQQTQQELTAISKNLAAIGQQIQLIAQTCDQRQQLLTLKQTDSQREAEQQQILNHERETLIADCSSGREFSRILTADTLEQFFNQQVSEAKNAQQQAADAVNTASTELATQKSQQQHWQQETTRRAESLQHALTTLNHALERLAINQEQLTELLQQDEHWLIEQKTHIEHAEKALQAATALLNIKTEDRKHHENPAVAISEDTATQTASELQQQKQRASEQKQDYEFQLREDDKKIASSSHLKADLNKQRHRWEQWQSLNELIGSANGAKFRIFAQSLTLEALLAHSNKHLADFAKRYCLQRVPSSDLELQIIDRDMADDVRSVHSLSGGESFLVSLALALGLASLSSNKTQVESLFIDEGFGSLDPETLDIAIASLDTLQALGRKVGVISHVPILVERIGAKVVVEKCGGGKSTVTIVGGY